MNNKTLMEKLMVFGIFILFAIKASAQADTYPIKIVYFAKPTGTITVDEVPSLSWENTFIQTDTSPKFNTTNLTTHLDWGWQNVHYTTNNLVEWTTVDHDLSASKKFYRVVYIRPHRAGY